MNVNKPGDAVSDVVSSLEGQTPPSAFISEQQQTQEAGDKPRQVKCKEGQDEVFDNCIRDDTLSKEQVEEQETTVDQV